MRVFAVVKNENPYVDNYAKLPKIYYAQFLIDAGLPGKTTIAVDDSKFKAVNSKKNNYNQKKIDKHSDQCWAKFLS